MAENPKLKVRPLADRILLRPRQARDRTDGGILLPDVAKEKFPAVGTVLAVGPGALRPDGTREPVPLAVGQEVVYGKYQGTDVELNGEGLKFVRVADVLAAFDPPGETRTVDVLGCARCGQDHAGLTFFPLDNAGPVGYPWWALCPAKGQPVQMREVPDDAPPETPGPGGRSRYAEEADLSHDE